MVRAHAFGVSSRDALLDLGGDASEGGTEKRGRALIELDQPLDGGAGVGIKAGGVQVKLTGGRVEVGDGEEVAFDLRVQAFSSWCSQACARRSSR